MQCVRIFYSTLHRAIIARICTIVALRAMVSCDTVLVFYEHPGVIVEDAGTLQIDLAEINALSQFNEINRID